MFFLIFFPENFLLSACFPRPHDLTNYHGNKRLFGVLYSDWCSLSPFLEMLLLFGLYLVRWFFKFIINFSTSMLYYDDEIAFCYIRSQNQSSEKLSWNISSHSTLFELYFFQCLSILNQEQYVTVTKLKAWLVIKLCFYFIKKKPPNKHVNKVIILQPFKWQ